MLAKARKKGNSPATAQETIPYLRMFQDGICQVDENHFSKTVQYYDINYELSHHDEKLAVLEEWGDFLNFFDPSVHFQFNYVNLQDDAVEMTRNFEPLRREGTDETIANELKAFLENVYAQGSNDQARLKFCTFTVTTDNLRAARLRLNQVEGGVNEHLKRLGCRHEVMDGKDRLRLLHTIFHLDKREQFNFDWKWLPVTGLSTKDFIAPSSFEFRESRCFKMGEKYASVSAIQILASRLDDTMLSELLNLDNSMVVTLHIKAYDQAEAIIKIHDPAQGMSCNPAGLPARGRHGSFPAPGYQPHRNPADHDHFGTGCDDPLQNHGMGGSITGSAVLRV